MSNTKKLAIVGYGRHGKDFVGEIISKFTYLKYGGSCSWHALPYIAEELGIHPQIAWEQRHDHRNFWYEYCNYLRRDDPSFLIKKVLAAGDLVVGVRDKVELHDMQKHQLVLSTIWVDAAPRITYVDPTVTFTKADANIVLQNRNDKEALYFSVYCLCKSLDLPMRHPDFLTSLSFIETNVPVNFIAPRTER